MRVPTEPPPGIVRLERMLVTGYFSAFHGVDFRGEKTWPDAGPLIVASNHPTYYDPFLVGMRMRRYVCWMAWATIFTWPMLGWLARAHGALPVDLERPKLSGYRQARAHLESGGALGVFPEGERTRGLSDLDPLKRGMARLAFETGAPVLPVSIQGARRCWPRDRSLPRPGKIVVTYHGVVAPENFTQFSTRAERESAFTSEVARRIACAL